MTGDDIDTALQAIEDAIAENIRQIGIHAYLPHDERLECHRERSWELSCERYDLEMAKYALTGIDPAPYRMVKK